MVDRSAPYVISRGETRREAAILPFLATKADTGGHVSVCTWMPQGVAHAFASAGPESLHALALAVPGGLEDLFGEQQAYFAQLEGPPDPGVLDEIAARHGAVTTGPPIRALDAPPAS